MFHLVRTGVVFASILCAVVVVEGREWTAYNGKTMRADFSGVKDGRVTLKSGTRRRSYVSLAALVLEDRDYVLRLLKSRKQEDRLQELLDHVVVRGLDSESDADLEPGGVDESRETTGSISRRRREPESEPESIEPEELVIYDINIPSPELVKPIEPREWALLTGESFLGQFQSASRPCHASFLLADGSVKRLPLCFLVTEDIQFLSGAIEEFRVKPLFAFMQSEPLSDAELAAGYRSFSDRSGNRVNAQLVRVAEDDVVLVFSGSSEEKSFPLMGLSPSDQSWVKMEIENRKRAEEEAVRKAEAEAARAEAAKKAEAVRQARLNSAPQTLPPAPMQETSFLDGQLGKIAVFVGGLVILGLMIRKMT